MRRGHPAANRTWSLPDYAASPHATVGLFADGLSEIDARLATEGIERRIALTTPHFMGTIAAVAATDLVTTISVTFARRFVESFDLVLREPPFDNDLELTVIGMALRARDPAMQWFRKLLREEAAAVYSECS
jgi:DNA-binding transcriptional LysR family regulator